MKGDFTRDTFDPRNNYTSVLMQQGRAQVDADWNEQAAIAGTSCARLSPTSSVRTAGPAPTVMVVSRSPSRPMASWSSVLGATTSTV